MDKYTKHRFFTARDLRSSKKNLLVEPVLTLTVMAVDLFLLLRRFFGTVFLRLFKTVENYFFLDVPF